MLVGGIGGAAATWLGTIGKTGDAGAADLFATQKTGKSDAAKPAALNTLFPTSSPAQLNADALLALQDAGEKKGAGDKSEVKTSAEDQFLDYMQKSPAERLRDKILKALGVTEDDIKNMTPDERMGLEKKIQEIIEETMVKAEGEGEPNAREDAMTAQPIAALPASAQASVKDAGVTTSAQFLLQLI